VKQDLRKFIIWFDDIEWEIREVGLDDYKKFTSYHIILFANFRIRNNKIVYLQDINITDYDIKKASKFNIFKEKCKFYINNSDYLENSIQNKSKNFEGSFIDALKYIKKYFIL